MGRKGSDPPWSGRTWHLGSGLIPPRPQPPAPKRPPSPHPAAEPWPGGLWFLRVSHCPPPQGQPFPEGPPHVSTLPVSSRQHGPINLFPSTPVPLSEFHRKYHRGSNPSGFRRVVACRDRKTLVFSALVAGPLPKLKQTDEDVLACHKGLQSAGQHHEGATSRTPFTDRVQRKKRSEKTLGGPEAGSNGGGCGGVLGETQETLRDQTGTPGPREGLG